MDTATDAVDDPFSARVDVRFRTNFEYKSVDDGCGRKRMSGLNAEQRRAVQTPRGPLLVLAGAGTGKTRVITYRVAELIRTGTAAERILAVTFTNKAAAEMQARIGSLLGLGKQGRPHVSTFHSYCVKILRRHIRRLGYPEKFAIYNRGDQESLARRVLREIRVSNQQLRPGDLLAQVGRWKSAAVRPPEAAAIARSDREHLAAVAYRRYQRSLKVAGALDFDDLLLCTEDLMSQHDEVRLAEARRFDHILIDEYQDTNASQYRIVQALAGEHRNLCVVGDDDQSIYSFRGAEVQHILGFESDWPDVKVVRLTRNYRSTQAILDRANMLISFNQDRHPKRLLADRRGGEKPRIEQYPNETDEAKAVVSEIQHRLADPRWSPSDFAILFRTNEQPRLFETELRRVKLPYRLIGGMSFFDRKEVGDMLAYLQLLELPQQEVALLRVINNPPRGIGKATVEALLARAVESGRPLWDLLSPSPPAGIPAKAHQAIVSFVGMIEGFRKRLGSAALSDLFRELVDKIGYREELNRLYPEESEQESRWASVEEIVNALASFESGKRRPTLSGFLEEIALSGRDKDEAPQERQPNAIVLMTMHSAKGLEFSQVYMVGMEEGLFPHHRSIKADGPAIDEERRLCYVGVTRAQDRLSLSMALTRMKWGKPRESHPSRFLFELTGVAEKAPSRNSGKRGRRLTARRR